MLTKERGLGEETDLPLSLLEILPDDGGYRVGQVMEGLAPIGDQPLVVNLIDVQGAGQADHQGQGAEEERQPVTEVAGEQGHAWPPAPGEGSDAGAAAGWGQVSVAFGSTRWSRAWALAAASQGVFWCPRKWVVKAGIRREPMAFSRCSKTGQDT